MASGSYPFYVRDPPFGTDSKWEVDGPAECQQLTGTNADWDRYWSAFLAILSKGLAEAVASFEDSVRY